MYVPVIVRSWIKDSSFMNIYKQSHMIGTSFWFALFCCDFITSWLICVIMYSPGLLHPVASPPLGLWYDSCSLVEAGLQDMDINGLAPGRSGSNFTSVCLNSFYGLISCALPEQLFKRECHKISVNVGSGIAVRHQSITWANVGTTTGYYRIQCWPPYGVTGTVG